MSREGITTAVSRVDLSFAIPEEWEEVGEVDKIYVYPMKSCRGVQVSQAKVTKRGLRHEFLQDRQFMLVSGKNGAPITARQFPKLVLIDVSYNGSSLTLTGPGVASKTVEISKDALNNPVDTKVWGKACRGFLIGEVANNWIVNYIKHHNADKPWITENLDIQVIFDPMEDGLLLRETHPEFDPLAPFTRPDDVPIFADEYPVHLETESSLSELNRRLAEKNFPRVIGKRQFRPNILTKGPIKAFSEDEWTYIKINDVIFRNGRLCPRCVLSTINPETGEKDGDGEPVATLKDFRSSLDREVQRDVGDSPFFGIFLGIDKCGTIQVGDRVYVGKIPDGWNRQRQFKLLFFKAYKMTCIFLAAKTIYSLYGDNLLSYIA